ncbi:MAG: DUF4845 domain-containing protein, partial [Woeseiaceae bacterium]|nr:DUF4845 domain-containing protein [Woeseiaceae bacterium]
MQHKQSERRVGGQSVIRGRDDQRGMTTLGFLILAAFVGLFAFAAIRLTPAYLNFMKVKGVVEGVYEEFDGQNASTAMIRNSIIRRFSVESISELEPRDIKVTQESGGFLVVADYDQQECCVRHDWLYYQGGGFRDRAAADRQFYHCVRKTSTG